MVGQVLGIFICSKDLTQHAADAVDNISLQLSIVFYPLLLLVEGFAPGFELPAFNNCFRHICSEFYFSDMGDRIAS